MPNVKFVCLVALLVIGIVPSTEARPHGGLSFGLSYGHYDPYWGPGNPYPPYYPPPVVYAPPPETYYYVAPVPPEDDDDEAIPANQASPTYIDDHGRTCREYQTIRIIDGKAQDIYGTACLQPDGTWRIVD